MKYPISFVLLLFIVLPACSDQPADTVRGSSVQSKDEQTKNPIAVQGDRMMDTLRQSNAIKDKASLEAIRSAIQSFRVTNDRFPATIDEIKPLLSSPDTDLSGYIYNPSDGSVLAK